MKVEIRKSNIDKAGLGVFAVEDIKKGERVGYYDGEDRRADTIDICEVDMSYALPKTKDNTIIRLGYPQSKTEHGIAQIINDGAMVNILEPKKEHVEEQIKKYQIEAKNKMNVCKENDNDFWFVAMRDIKAGEELYYAYGVNYWISKLLKESTDSLIRLLCYSFLYSIDKDKTESDTYALYLFMCVMNHDLESEYWTNILSKYKPNEYLQIILKQIKVLL